MLSAPLETDHRLVVVMLDAVSDRYTVDIFSCFIPFVLLSLYLRTVAIRQPFFVSLSLSLQPVAIFGSHSSYYLLRFIVLRLTKVEATTRYTVDTADSNRQLGNG